MSVAPSYPAAGPVKGAPPTLEWIAVERLQIDPSYQRATDSPLSRKMIVGMVKGWDWTLCQPLVVARRLDGSLFILDGQHRHSGAVARADIPHLPCVVLTGCEQADEAQTFVALNTRRQKLSQCDIFNGMLAAGDENAKATAELLDQTGWRVRKSSASDQFRPGDLVCAPMLAASVKTHGEAVVRNALTALREAYPETPVRSTAKMLRALIAIYRDGDLNGGDPDAFIESLGSVLPDDWPDYAREQRRASPVLNGTEGLAAAMVAAYHDHVASLADAA